MIKIDILGCQPVAFEYRHQLLLRRQFDFHVAVNFFDPLNILWSGIDKDIQAVSPVREMPETVN